MKFALAASVAALAIAFAAPAYAACTDDIATLRTDLEGDKSFRDQYSTGAVRDADYARLIAAAEAFGRYGQESRCRDVLAGVRELAKQHTSTPMRDARPNEKRAAYLLAAQPIASASGSVERIIGSDVRNANDNDLGDVSDLQFESGQLKYAVIGRGGFLGMGVSHYLVPAAQIRVAADYRTVIVDMTDEQMKAMPRVTRTAGSWAPVANDRTAPSAPRATPPVNREAPAKTN